MIQLLKNSIDLFTARLINVLSQLGIVVLISRRLGPDDFGEFSFLNAVVLTGIVVAGFGLDTFMVREISRDHDRGNPLIWAIFKFKLISSFIVMCAVYILFRYMFDTHEISNMLTLFSVIIFLNSLSQSLWFYSDAFNKFKTHAFLWATSNLIKLGFVWLLLSIKTDLSMVIYAVILSEIVTLIYSYGTIEKIFHIKPVHIPLNDLLLLFKRSYPIAIIFILSALYFRIDLIMLKLLAVKEALGFYAASFRIVEFISIIPSTIYIAAFPNLSKDYVHDHSNFSSSTNKTLLFLGPMALIAALFIYLFSNIIINTLYGPSFIESDKCLKILSVVIFLIFFNGYFAYLNLSKDNEKLIVRILLTATLFKILLNYFLIPKYSHVGSAFSALFSESLILVLYCVPFIRALHLRGNALSNTKV